ncbi:MAG: PD-(D/E)XK nuclease family protein [Candidatus Diapherotrites archaeon]|nr:PD-(D/E)XK nuclease family protein [Candidatus Diapherotrites archaeon]
MTLYSYSRINCFFQCPLKFKFNYIEKPKVELRQGIEAFMGKRVHETLEYLYKLVQHTKLPESKELINFYEKQWTENWNELIVINKEGLNSKHYHDLGIKCIKNYYSKNYPFNSGTVLGIEKKIIIDLNGKFKVQGFIDRLDESKPGHYEIHDYKTYSTLPEQSKFDQDTQLALYAIGLQQEFKDLKSVDLVWHLVVFGKEMRTHRTKKQLNELKKETIQKIKEIESAKEFPARKTALCDWCDYQNYCPEFKHEIETEQLPANKYLKEEGVVLANKFIELKTKEKEIETELNELKQAITLYAKEKGYNVLIGSNGKISIHETKSMKLPKKDSKEYEQLEKIIKKINKWNELTSLDQTKIKKFLEEKPNKKIEELMEERETITIRATRK